MCRREEGCIGTIGLADASTNQWTLQGHQGLARALAGVDVALRSGPLLSKANGRRNPTTKEVRSANRISTRSVNRARAFVPPGTAAATGGATRRDWKLTNEGVGRGMRRFALLGAIVMTLAFPLTVAATSEAISGTVANDASWAYYTTSRWTTLAYYGPQLQVLSWSGTDQYYYLRDCTTGNPIGAGTPNSPVKAAVNDTSWKQLGPLPNGTCFLMTAKKDWSWPTGYSWWTGNLQY